MINNLKSKIVSLFLSKEKKQKINEDNNLILSLKDKYKEFHAINSDELNFYNLLIINIEKIFQLDDLHFNDNFIFKTDIDKFEGGDIDGSTYTEKKLRFSVEKENTYQPMREFNELTEALEEYCDTIWKNNFELKIEMVKLFYGTDIENVLEKKIDKVLSKKVLNKSNRYGVYKELLLICAEPYCLDSNLKEKYTQSVDIFLENLKDMQSAKNIEITLNNLNYNGVFLFSNEKGLFSKKDIYKNFIIKHNKNLLQCEIEKVLSFIINKKEPLNLYVKQRYDNDGILQFTIKNIDSGNLIYEGEYGLLLEQFNPKYRKTNFYLKKENMTDDKYLISMLSSLGENYKDYIKNGIDIKNASEQKKELEKVLLPNENKLVEAKKRRI